MLRVMLIDDEKISLEGLRVMINWSAEGFKICAECTNAFDALALLPSLLPDLIMTDIRLPGMDGLEFIKEARARGFLGQFIVVSGYNFFEYAQKALSMGAAGYLLKPIESDDAAQVLDYVRKMLVHQEADGSRNQAAYHRSMTALLGGQDLPSDALPSGEYWRLCTWGAPLPYEVVSEILKVLPKGQASAHILDDKEYLALHWSDKQSEPLWGEADTILNSHQRKPVYSPMTMNIKDLPALRLTLDEALNADCNALIEQIKILSKSVALRQADVFKLHCIQLESFCNACGAKALHRVRQHFISDCARQLAHRPDELNIFLATQGETIEGMGLLAIRLLAPVKDRISDRAIVHMKEHFMNDLTLESVAEALAYNAAYLGRVFKEEQGRSFRDWLNGYRMQHASKLLHETNELVYNIANKSGYIQYKRFLKYFKQCYGETPEQYRKNKANFQSDDMEQKL